MDQTFVGNNAKELTNTPFAPPPHPQKSNIVTEEIVEEKGGISKAVLVLLGVVIIFAFLVVGYAFFVPLKAPNIPFASNLKEGDVVFSEMVTYLFRDPILGEVVVFKPYEKESLLGIILAKEKSDTALFRIASESNETFVVDRAQINRRVWHPPSPQKAVRDVLIQSSDTTK